MSYIALQPSANIGVNFSRFIFKSFPIILLSEELSGSFIPRFFGAYQVISIFGVGIPRIPVSRSSLFNKFVPPI